MESIPSEYRDNVVAAMTAVQKLFPFQYGDRRLVLKDLKLGKFPDYQDAREQKDVRISGGRWAVPLSGKFELYSGDKLMDTGTSLLLHVPLHTDRQSFILNRSEYYVINQNRLKPGIYTRVRASGDAETLFNLSKGANFKLHYDPERKLFTMLVKSSTVPVYPVLRLLGVADSEMEKAWGPDILAANRKAQDRTVYLSKALGKPTSSKDEAGENILAAFKKTEIETPDVPERTIGIAAKTVDGPVLLATTSKLRKAVLGQEAPDNRDSLENRWLLGAPDFIHERILRSDLPSKLARRAYRNDTVSGILGGSGVLDSSVWAIFSSAGLADRSPQTNPIAADQATGRVSILGEGGVGTLKAVTEEARQVHPTFLGVIDPIQTPESEKVGVIYPLASGVILRNKEAWIPVVRQSNGKNEHVPFHEVFKGNLALSDEHELGRREKRLVRAVREGELVEVASKEVDFLVRPASTLSFTSRLIPFLGSDSPNRVEMAGRFMPQALLLPNREAPLVQVAIPGTEHTVEKALGMLLVRRAPEDGVVEKVQPDLITIKGKSGTTKVHVPHMFPLNDGKSYETHDILVRPGDQVKQGAILTESNATKNSTLAVGVNARVGYMFDGGYNFEDAVTISESLAKRLSYKALTQTFFNTEDMAVGINEYSAVVSPLTQEERAKLDNGVVRPGTLVQRGDLIVAAVRKSPLTKEEKLIAKSKRDVMKMRDSSVYWDRDYPGIIQEVQKTDDGYYVSAVSEEPVRVGDKVAGRHGNKGVVGRILPDEEMPKTADGKPLEILMNPYGVAKRMNIGQVYESLTGKAAKKLGHPISVPQFPTEELVPSSGLRKVVVPEHLQTYYVGKDKTPTKLLVQEYSYVRDYKTLVEELLKKAGLEDTEEVFFQGRSVGKVLTGEQYLMRLEQLSEDKEVLRGQGHPYYYSSEGTPIKGAEDLGSAEMESPQALDRYMTQALLAHGAVSNIRDALTYKGDKGNDAVWAAIQQGSTLPPPVVPFVNQKFEAYLNAMGLRVDRDGDEVSMFPMTDKEVLEQSNGEITKPTFFSSDDGRAKPGELFDERITGGLDGRGWGHVTLATPIPNPLFARPIAVLLGLAQKEVPAIAAGTRFLHKGKDGWEVNDLSSGSVALEDALEGIDPKRELKTEEDPRRRGYLAALDQMGVGADVYMLEHVPVLPPIFRPVLAAGQRTMYADANLLYADLITANNALKGLAASSPGVLREKEGADLRGRLLESAAVLYGSGGTSHQNREAKGFLEQLHGPTSKYGYIQHKLLWRRQDLSARAVIVPGPELNLDEVGIPYATALTLYKPFVVRELGMTPLQSRKLIEDNPEDPLVRKALEQVIATRPIWMKRDPVLHKFNVMAFYPRITTGHSVKFHPLLTSCYNGDFDGDTVSLFVPVSDEAVREAQRSVPSKLIENPATGGFMHTPTYEAMFGLYRMTQVGNKTSLSFGSVQDAVNAVESGTAKFSDQVTVDGKATTIGRAVLSSILPEDLRGEFDLARPALTQSTFKNFATQVGKKYPGAYGKIIDTFDKIGFKVSVHDGTTLPLKDLTSYSDERGKIMAEYDKVRGKSWDVRNKKAMELLSDLSSFDYSRSGSLHEMNLAEGKPSREQMQQIVLSSLFAPWGDKLIPLSSNFGEGMSAMDYWSITPSARKGVMQKVSEVTLPGDLTKQMLATTMSMSVAKQDCGSKGVNRPLEESLDYVLGADLGPYKGGTLVNTDIIEDLKRRGISRAPVRSPLTCQEGEGVCAKCYGAYLHGALPKVGDNVGITAAHALGERSTQLTLRGFHTGGFGELPPVKQLANLIRLPSPMPGRATISKSAGTVARLEKTSEGTEVYVSGKEGEEKHFIPPNRKVTVAVGDTVKIAQPLSSGIADPREVMDITGDLYITQKSMVDSIADLYKKYKLRSKNYEVLVRSITNLAEVEDSGASPYLKGDLVPYQLAQAWNRENDSSLKVVPVLKGVSSLPQYRDDWLSALGYRNIKRILSEAAAVGEKATLRSLNPTAAMLMDPVGFAQKKTPEDSRY